MIGLSGGSRGGYMGAMDPLFIGNLPTFHNDVPVDCGQCVWLSVVLSVFPSHVFGRDRMDLPSRNPRFATRSIEARSSQANLIACLAHVDRQFIFIIHCHSSTRI